MCIRKCNITALIFLRPLDVGAGLHFNGISIKHNTSTLKERLLLDECSNLNIDIVSYKSLIIEEHVETEQ